MVDSQDKGNREESLQTHVLNRLRLVFLEALLALNLSAFIISFFSLIVRHYQQIFLYLSGVIWLIFGGYLVALVVRGDRLGYLYYFCAGLGAAIAWRHHV